MPWEAAGSRFVAGATAYAAARAVAAVPGDPVAVAGAAGGVGSIAVQLAARTGAIVLGLAGSANQEWLRARGVLPVIYGEGVAQRIREAAPEGVDAFIDTVGGGYVEMALELGVAPEAVTRGDRRGARERRVEAVAVPEVELRDGCSATVQSPTLIALRRGSVARPQLLSVRVVGCYGARSTRGG